MVENGNAARFACRLTIAWTNMNNRLDPLLLTMTRTLFRAWWKKFPAWACQTCHRDEWEKIWQIFLSCQASSHQDRLHLMLFSWCLCEQCLTEHAPSHPFRKRFCEPIDAILSKHENRIVIHCTLYKKVSTTNPNIASHVVMTVFGVPPWETLGRPSL